MQSVEVFVLPPVVAVEEELHHLLGRGSVRHQEGLVLGLEGGRGVSHKVFVSVS